MPFTVLIYKSPLTTTAHSLIRKFYLINVLPKESLPTADSQLASGMALLCFACGSPSPALPCFQKQDRKTLSLWHLGKYTKSGEEATYNTSYEMEPIRQHFRIPSIFYMRRKRMKPLRLGEESCLLLLYSFCHCLRKPAATRKPEPIFQALCITSSSALQHPQ